MLGLAMDRQGLPKALQRRKSVRCDRVMVDLALAAGRRCGGRWLKIKALQSVLEKLCIRY
jgi:hypothetical protein